MCRCHLWRNGDIAYDIISAATAIILASAAVMALTGVARPAIIIAQRIADHFAWRNKSRLAAARARTDMSMLIHERCRLAAK